MGHVHPFSITTLVYQRGPLSNNTIQGADSFDQDMDFGLEPKPHAFRILDDWVMFQSKKNYNYIVSPLWSNPIFAKVFHIVKQEP